MNYAWYLNSMIQVTGQGYISYLNSKPIKAYPSNQSNYSRERSDCSSMASLPRSNYYYPYTEIGFTNPNFTLNANNMTGLDFYEKTKISAIKIIFPQTFVATAGVTDATYQSFDIQGIDDLSVSTTTWTTIKSVTLTNLLNQKEHTIEFPEQNYRYYRLINGASNASVSANLRLSQIYFGTTSKLNLKISDLLNGSIISESLEVKLYENGDLFQSYNVSNGLLYVQDLNTESVWTFSIERNDNYSGVSNINFTPTVEGNLIEVKLIPIIGKKFAFNVEGGMKPILLEVKENGVVTQAHSINTNTFTIAPIDTSKTNTIDITSSRYEDALNIPIVLNHDTQLISLVRRKIGDKILILSNDNYKTFDGESWNTISESLSAEVFLDKGMDSLSPLLDCRVETLETLRMNEDEISQAGGKGKTFSKLLSLKQYPDIRKITSTEVRKVVIQIDKAKELILSMNNEDYTKGSLSWKNPTNDVIKKNVVAYSYSSYPTEESKGTVLYEGEAIETLSLEGLQLNKSIYVSVFCYNEDTYSVVNTSYVPINIAPVSALTVSFLNPQLNINWNNPTNTELKQVIVKYSTAAYPTENTGTVVYDGTGSSTSFDALGIGKNVYISVFSYGKNGSISSAAQTEFEFTQIDKVKALAISSSGSSRTVSWVNPTNTPLKKVSVRYNRISEPTETTGTEIYNGTGTSTTFTPINVVSTIEAFYVKVFAYASNGTMSSNYMVGYVNNLTAEQLSGSEGYVNALFGTFGEAEQDWIPGSHGLKVNTKEGIEEMFELINMSFNSLTASEKTTVSASSLYKNITNPSVKPVLIQIVDATEILGYSTLVGVSQSKIDAMQNKLTTTRASYTALSFAFKGAVSASSIHALVSSENKMTELLNDKAAKEKEMENQRQAQVVINQIDALDSMTVGTSVYKNAVVKAREAYKAIPFSVKVLVTNVPKLVEHEKNI